MKNKVMKQKSNIERHAQHATRLLPCMAGCAFIGIVREGSSMGHMSSSAMSSRTYGQSGLTSPSWGENSPTRMTPFSEYSRRQYWSVAVCRRRWVYEEKLGYQIAYRVLLRVSWFDNAARNPNRVASFAAYMHQNLLSRLAGIAGEQLLIRVQANWDIPWTGTATAHRSVEGLQSQWQWLEQQF